MFTHDKINKIRVNSGIIHNWVNNNYCYINISENLDYSMISTEEITIYLNDIDSAR